VPPHRCPVLRRADQGPAPAFTDAYEASGLLTLP
jgi:hypothetical protein